MIEPDELTIPLKLFKEYNLEALAVVVISNSGYLPNAIIKAISLRGLGTNGAVVLVLKKLKLSYWLMNDVQLKLAGRFRSLSNLLPVGLP